MGSYYSEATYQSHYPEISPVKKKSCKLSKLIFSSLLSVKTNKHKRGKRRTINRKEKRVPEPKTPTRFLKVLPTISPESQMLEPPNNNDLTVDDYNEDHKIAELNSVELLAEHLHFCEICGNGFKRDANLRMHMRAHGNKFKTPEALAKPLDCGNTHRNSRRFSCPFEDDDDEQQHEEIDSSFTHNYRIKSDDIVPSYDFQPIRLLPNSVPNFGSSFAKTWNSDFNLDHQGNLDRETKAIVVKTPQLKRKSEAAGFEADSGVMMTHGSTEPTNSPSQTTVSRKMGELQNLDTLFLQENALSGSLTWELGNLKSLKSMDLSNNMLTCEIPTSFSELKNLMLLNLFRNKLHGAIPEFVVDMTALEVVQLWENNFTGNIPMSLGRNGRLTLLDLSSNKLTGTLPPYLCSGNHLQTLITLGNFLFGPIPESLGSCESMNKIRMGDNFLNGSIPKGLFGFPKLTQVEIQDNYLSGNFPETHSVSDNLGQITLSNNQLLGPLPPSIGDFSSMQKLLLDGNMFNGKIPSQIGRLQQLSKIDFSHNKFSGPIAPEISQCKLLSFVDLSWNELSGVIPNEITGMRIYDITNVLEGISLIDKKIKNIIQWKDLEKFYTEKINGRPCRLMRLFEKFNKPRDKGIVIASWWSIMFAPRRC